MTRSALERAADATEFEDTAVLWVYDGEPHPELLSADVMFPVDEPPEGGRGFTSSRP